MIQSDAKRTVTFSLLLMGLLAAGVVPAKGQGVDVNPGVRVGGNYVTFGGDTDAFGSFTDDASVEDKHRFGFAAGGFALLDFGNGFGLQPGLRYIQRGYETEIRFDSQRGTGTGWVGGQVELAYIDVPILARYAFGQGSVSPYILAGPHVGVNVMARTSLGDSGDQDISDDVNSVDYGLEGGVGLGVDLGGSTMSIDARYGLGLSNIVSEGDENTISGGDEVSITNQTTVMLTVGFSF